ncbi:MAG: helix-turn-helix domain-containing protein [Bryobacteraceae bacterium]
MAQSSGAKTPVPSRPNLLAGEDLPPPPTQKRSLEKRIRLIRAALVLFREKGYNLTSIDDIARHANFAVGGFYQHFRSKRQLLLVLMDDLLERLSRLDLGSRRAAEIRVGLRTLLAQAFSTDLQYLGAYRAWQEAVASDGGLADKQEQIQTWTTARVMTAFSLLQKMPGARSGVDIAGLARVIDSFFWNLLAQACRFPESELNRWIDSATHLIYHALFTDSPSGGVQR